MRKFSQKVLACLLSAGMVVSLGGVTALATETEDAATISEGDAVALEATAVVSDASDATVNYAVKIWGIQADTYSTDGGATTQTAGLTFGPATGDDYTNSYVSCGSAYCIHDMTWEEIIEQSKTDPTVFESCRENGCTKAVELTPNETLFDMETVENAAAQGYAGDGVSTLYYLLNGVGGGSAYGASWNLSSEEALSTDPASVYSRSRLRTTLTGDRANIDTWLAENSNASDFYGVATLCDGNNCLFSCFPEELQEAVVPRTTVNTGNATSGARRGYDTTTTYDKLFLFSVRETGITESTDDSGGNDYRVNSLNENRIAYEYSDTSASTPSRAYWWTRSRDASNSASSFAITYNGGSSADNVTACYGISPGFVLPGPETGEEEPPEQSEYPESSHNYGNNEDAWWTYTLTGATNGVYVTFDERTKVESNWDFLYVYDGDDNLIGKYTGEELAGATLYIPSDTFKINLTSDGSTTYWGFAVTNVEAAGDTLDLSIVGSVDDPLVPVYVNEEPVADVLVNGASLIQGADFTVSADTSTAGKTVDVTITGIGNYSGMLTSHVYVYDDAHLQEGASITPDVYTPLRLTEASSMGELFGESTIPFDDMDEAYRNSITEVTLRPVETNEAGEITGDTTSAKTGGLTYPEAPKKLTITAANNDFYVEGSYVHFYRTEDDPIVYVTEGHGRPYVTGTSPVETYPQTQVYEVTVKAPGYKDVVGTTTYYTGTASAFSIIVDEDGNENTTDDQWVAGSWTAGELEKMATFANGTSQCGMTGFRTFSTMGVSLYDMLDMVDETLKEEGKDTLNLSANDYFKINTSDNYGNYKTYKQIFETPQYFISGIYDSEFAEVYNNAVDRDGDAGYDHDIRLWLGKYAWEKQTTIEPRLCTSYKEVLITGDELEGAEEPTLDNTHFNSLVSFENRFRFVYGIALVQEDCEVTFDTQGGSAIDSQTVLSHHMTSSELTTMWQSYWADSLVILRGEGVNHPDTDPPLTGTDTIAVPDDPTRTGYVFSGWYTDPDCTDGNEFDFSANDGTVDEDTTIYAKWVTSEEILRDALEEEVEEAKTMNKDAYSADSWAAFEKALESAEAVLNNPNASLESLSEALDALENAKNGLVGSGVVLKKDSDGVWRYYVNGEFNKNYSGFASNAYGDWYVKNGCVLFDTTDILKDTTGVLGDKGAWYYVIDSKVQYDFTGLSNFKNANGWWYIVKGKVDFTHNGVDKNKNGWFYVTDGKVQFGFTGLANYKNNNGWWYITKGAVDFTHNGVDKNKNGWWYVTGGKVQFGFTGLANYKNSNGWWYVSGGKVDFTHSGVDKNKYGWFYVAGGKVQFGFTGLASNKNGTWYINGGAVQFGFNGTVTAGGRRYTVRNGKVV